MIFLLSFPLFNSLDYLRAGGSLRGYVAPPAEENLEPSDSHVGKKRKRAIDDI